MFNPDHLAAKKYTPKPKHWASRKIMLNTKVLKTRFPSSFSLKTYLLINQAIYFTLTTLRSQGLQHNLSNCVANLLSSDSSRIQRKVSLYLTPVFLDCWTCAPSAALHYLFYHCCCYLDLSVCISQSNFISVLVN